MQLRWGTHTDTGKVRQQNEDALLAEAGLFAVADGMGGHNAGEVASALAVTTLKAGLREGIATSDVLRSLVQQANSVIYTASLDDSTQAGMGTTLTAVAVVPEGDGHILVANVGDSRTYLLRNGDMRCVTTDHSYVQELVNEGVISAEDARTHPRRNIVTRALGIDRNVTVDVQSLRVEPGDRLMLCSDGLVDEVTDADIADILRMHPVPGEAAQTLVNSANAAGGRDNTTVVVIDVVGDDIDISGDSTRPFVTPLLDDATPAAMPAPEVKTKKRSRVLVTLSVIVVVAIVAIGLSVLGMYARSGYFIGEKDGVVVVYRGRPGGVLWFKPTISAVSDVKVEDLPPTVVSDVEGERTFSSSLSAQKFLQFVESATTTTTTSTTTTTTTSTTSSTSTTVP
jgi:protein phosphatase